MYRIHVRYNPVSVFDYALKKEKKKVLLLESSASSTSVALAIKSSQTPSLLFLRRKERRMKGHLYRPIAQLPSRPSFSLHISFFFSSSSLFLSSRIDVKHLGVIYFCIMAGDSLAEPVHARLFPGSQLVPLAAGRHASRRHRLFGLHLGN